MVQKTFDTRCSRILDGVVDVLGECWNSLKHKHPLAVRRSDQDSERGLLRPRFAIEVAAEEALRAWLAKHHPTVRVVFSYESTEDLLAATEGLHSWQVVLFVSLVDHDFMATLRGEYVADCQEDHLPYSAFVALYEADSMHQGLCLDACCGVTWIRWPASSWVRPKVVHLRPYGASSLAEYRSDDVAFDSDWVRPAAPLFVEVLDWFTSPKPPAEGPLDPVLVAVGTAQTIVRLLCFVPALSALCGVSAWLYVSNPLRGAGTFRLDDWKTTGRTVSSLADTASESPFGVRVVLAHSFSSAHRSLLAVHQKQLWGKTFARQPWRPFGEADEDEDGEDTRSKTD